MKEIKLPKSTCPLFGGELGLLLHLGTMLLSHVTNPILLLICLGGPPLLPLPVSASAQGEALPRAGGDETIWGAQPGSGMKALSCQGLLLPWNLPQAGGKRAAACSAPQQGLYSLLASVSLSLQLGGDHR